MQQPDYSTHQQRRNSPHFLSESSRAGADDIEDKHINTGVSGNLEESFIQGLPIYSQDARDFFNTIFTSTQRCDFYFDDQPYELIFTHQCYSINPEVQFCLSLDGAELQIGLEHFTFFDLESLRQLGSLPEQVRALYAESRLNVLCQRIEQQSGSRVRLKKIDLENIAVCQAPGQRIDFKIRHAQSRMCSKGYLVPDQEAFQLLYEWVSELPAGQNRVWKNLIMDMSIEIGRARISYNDLGRIGFNDVILPDQCVFENEQGPCRIRIGPDFYLQGFWREGQFIYNGNGKGVIMEDMPDYQTNDNFDADFENPDSDQEEIYEDSKPPGLDLADLPIDLRFEIGQKKISMTKLQSLQPGFVFDMNRPENSPVQIIANGKLIGNGEIVRLSGMIGVRVKGFCNE
ncbi:MAG: YscQ/HrcQ family type III secretion apparatus protein [Desulfobacteraceae bacterium]|nr:YscQ/HrcQ family type III secretion apparatus protein [Desulfobacteraceae bacterium]